MMTTREISKEELQHLHSFCIQHAVQPYDVRVELVDHLASSIEAIWDDTPDMKYEDALNAVYARYGPMGFRSLMRDKEISVERAFSNGVKKAIFDFRKFPYLVGVMLLVLLCVYFYTFYAMGDVRTPMIFLRTIGAMLLGHRLWFAIWEYLKRKTLLKPLLCTNTFWKAYILEYIVLLKLFGIYFFTDSLVTTPPAQFVFIATCIIVAFIINISMYRHVSYVFDHAKKLYPMAFR